MGWMAGHPTKIPGYESELTHDSPTIAEVMKSAGYATYMTGKWHVTSHMAPNGPKGNWPLQRGFEHYYGSIKGGGSYYDPATLTRQNKPITPDDDPDYQPEHYYYTDAIGDQASRYIKAHHEQDGDKPMFMYVAFTSPHWPMQAPEETIAKYKGKYDGGYEPIRQARFERMKKLGLIDANWQLSPQWGEWDSDEHKAWEARCMEVYAAQVDRMDQNIGKIVAALKDAGEYDNTLLLFLSDNGGCAENMGRDVHEDRAKAAATQPMKPDEVELDVFPKFTREGKPMRDGYIVMPGPADTFIAYGQGWANVSNTPFKEYKHWVHEGGISTPLIAHWPAGISRHGVIESQPGHVVDLMATAADVGQAKDDKPIDGVSLVPAFAGKPLNRPKPIFWEHEGNRAVRDGKWKLVATGAKGDMGAVRHGCRSDGDARSGERAARSREVDGGGMGIVGGGEQGAAVAGFREEAGEKAGGEGAVAVKGESGDDHFDRRAGLFGCSLCCRRGHIRFDRSRSWRSRCRGSAGMSTSSCFLPTGRMFRT